MSFQCFGASEGRKVGSLKRQVRSYMAGWEIKNCTRLWREAHFEVKMLKVPQRRSTFGRLDVEKAPRLWREEHFEVIRSQKVKSTSCSEHSWKLHGSESARGCSAMHISKPKCEKHLTFGTLLKAVLLKKGRFWKLCCSKSARRCGAKHMSKWPFNIFQRRSAFCKLSCRKSARGCGAKQRPGYEVLHVSRKVI